MTLSPRTMDERMESFVASCGRVPSGARRLADSEARWHASAWLRRLLGKGIACYYVIGYTLADEWWTFCFDRVGTCPGDAEAESWSVERYGSDGQSWSGLFSYLSRLNIWTGTPANKGGSTLGDILYAGSSRSDVPESEWRALLQGISLQRRVSLHELYHRTNGLVFTLALRITEDPEAASDLTSDVFHHIWRCASNYTPARGSVLGWILSQARSKAAERMRREDREKPVNRHPSGFADGALSSTGEPQWGVLLPPASLWGQLAKQLTPEADLGADDPSPKWSHPAWDEVAPGIFCKFLSNDIERDRVSLLVHLEPDVEYPPHRHASVEELHLLHGELWIDNRKLHAGDYNRAAPDTSDRRVWSSTGCTCVLVTSPSDVLS